MDPMIANKALDLAMEWGEHFMKPTQPRLKVLYPQLTDQELDEYEKIARAAFHFGCAYVYEHPECSRIACSAVVRAKYPWVSGDNLMRLHSQAQYFAHK